MNDALHRLLSLQLVQLRVLYASTCGTHQCAVCVLRKGEVFSTSYASLRAIIR
jgi:hypothetical protein